MTRLRRTLCDMRRRFLLFGMAVALGGMVLMPLVAPAPAMASIHTYHEQAGQTTLRSRQSLRDQNDMAWQTTLFKRYRDGAEPTLYLRLVGFPGQVTLAPDKELRVTTGTLVEWKAFPSLDATTKELPPNVGQYRFDPVMAALQEAIPLTLIVPLRGGASARLVVAPFVVREWLQLNSMEPDGDGAV
jgi:hypothetical protein